MTYGDELISLTPNTGLDQILGTDQILRTACRDPSDKVWNAQDKKESIRLLYRNSSLVDFPFSPVLVSSTDTKLASGQGPGRFLPASSQAST